MVTAAFRASCNSCADKTDSFENARREIGLRSEVRSQQSSERRRRVHPLLLRSRCRLTRRDRPARASPHTHLVPQRLCVPDSGTCTTGRVIGMSLRAPALAPLPMPLAQCAGTLPLGEAPPTERKPASEVAEGLRRRTHTQGSTSLPKSERLRRRLIRAMEWDA
ncbi:hypothetical protein FOA52_006110 [Chlamydomonas sp. UWO 241]|nr:hypothetical protein FOA52_006110 [Chlamydomonas sp. UWO 241]